MSEETQNLTHIDLSSVSEELRRVIEELQVQALPENMTNEEKESYQAEVVEQVMQNCIKDMLKQIKKARRDPLLKRDFIQVFTQ
ncbi:DUF3069 domain-containing protein [Vibrio pectenicida]|uniref:DUF3069 domain-containing protein n=1 Tax=Vibrio pectenicida TaxID=62763 RepID=A0A7Y4A174_9VIBR|nr:DUF3069 domain-containing protein [Vibrio pectenicida]NOH72762.1 DUF3069 domain-containing protein [Vibrio pectenicida]